MPTTSGLPWPRADDAPRLARRDDRDRVRAFELGDGELHGAQQVLLRRAMPMRVHEMRDGLAVGLRAERVALRLQPLAQRFEVLDDAVVHDRDLAAGQVRMRIDRRRRAVRRPARVRDAGGARRGGAPCACASRSATRAVDTSRSSAVPCAPFEDREPGRVVAAILEPADAFDQDRERRCAGRPRRRCRTCWAPIPVLLSLTGRCQPCDRDLGARAPRQRAGGRVLARSRCRAPIGRACRPTSPAPPARSWSRCSRGRR